MERAIVEVAKANQTDGYRMGTAMASRRLERPVNRKRVLRVMSKHGLIQRRRRPERRYRPGRFKLTRSNQLWHLDRTSVWVASQGWCYPMAVIDGGTREVVGWRLEIRCRAIEAVRLIGRTAAARGIVPGQLTLGPTFKLALAFQMLGSTGRRDKHGRDRRPPIVVESLIGAQSRLLAC